MTRDHWSQVEDILPRVLAVSGDDRERLLAELCGDQPDLRREVEALIDVEQVAGDFMEAPVLRHGEGQPDLEIGQTIGAYQLVEFLGAGGMGTVYLAERRDQEFEQRVALKVIRTDLETGRTERRFLQERQILARLEHPNIASLKDGGTTNEGLPFFVMEYVEGTPIDRYSKSLAVRDRIQLFRKICSAVQFLHQNLVLHRDLKPSNILVTHDGTPKLLDFGIAKLLESNPADFLRSEDTGPTPMTVDYACPEQVRGAPVTTACDVYSLGVLLYRLLTGKSPYESANSVKNLLDQICETTPPAPSAAAAGSKNSIPRDLDRIVFKAMEKEPHLRYASAEQFSEDLGHFLEGLPVRACRPTWAYRCQKFVQRHRGGLATMLLVLAVISFFGYQMKVVKDEKEVERRESAQKSRFLEDLLESQVPENSGGTEPTVYGLLEFGLSRLDERFEGPSKVRASLLGNLGAALLAVPDLELAEQALVESQAIFRNLDSDPKDIIEATMSLARLRSLERKYEEAEELLRQSLQMARELGLEVKEFQALGSLTGPLLAQAKFADAETTAREAHQIAIQIFGRRSQQATEILSTLIGTHRAQGGLREADTLCSEGLERWRRFASGFSYGDLANICGAIALDNGDLETAETLFVESLKLWHPMYRYGHGRLSSTYNNLAIVSLLRRDYSQAKLMLTQAQQWSGPPLRQDDLAELLENEARVLLTQGKPNEASDLAKLALMHLEEILPENHLRIAGARSVLGGCLMELGQFEDAKKLLVRGSKGLPSISEETAWQTGRAPRRVIRLGGIAR